MKRPTTRPTEQRAGNRSGPIEDNDPVSSVAGAGLAPALRRRGAGVRSWLRVDSDGKTEVVEADKYAIMRRVSIPARDLRILDPNLSYPSTVLGREKAIVVNLEHIKCIITSGEVLLLNWKSPEVSLLIDDLKHRLPTHFNALGQQMAGDGGGGISASELEAALSEPLPDKPQDPGSVSLQVNGVKRLAQAALGIRPIPVPEPLIIEDEDSKLAVHRKEGGPNALPFEFRALEACLEAACSYLEKEASRLEQEAYPALDELTATISTLNLERVRQIKSRLVAISGRVQKVRDELEHLLDDDDDMREMYLTQKTAVDGSHVSSKEVSVAMAPDWASESSSRAFGSEFRAPGTTDPGSRPQIRGGIFDSLAGLDQVPLTDMDVPLLDSNPELTFPTRSKPSEDSKNSFFASRAFGHSLSAHSGVPSTSSSGSKSLDVEELEMLLEAYFVQIEGTLNKLSSLREYVEDTEDYINIMLDDKQNSLLQMNVFLTTATLFITMVVVVTGAFGMNMPLWLFDPDNPDNYKAFYYIIVGSFAGAIVLFTLVIMYIRKKGLIA